MMWNTILWLALACMALLILIKPIRSLIPVRARKSSDSKRNNLFLTICLPIGAVLLFSFSSCMTGENVPSFTEEDKAGVIAFAEAIDYYTQATEISSAEGSKPTEVWETVRAILEASLDKAEEVDESVLNQIHPELGQHVKAELLPGLHAGIYGITQFISGSPKEMLLQEKLDTDSLEYGGELLNQWNLWYDSKKMEIEPILASVQ